MRPLVSVVTPSLNQERFLRATIESVLAQSHAAIEYLVIDGGSTDGSIELLREYCGRLDWTSEPDLGQTDAIAKGFRNSRGEILGWLNSDDLLTPHAIRKIVEAFSRHPDASLVYGEGSLIDEAGGTTGPCWWVEPFDLWRLAHASNFVLQPAAFFRRSAYEAVGGLDARLHYSMDWDLWLRLAQAGEVVHLDEDLARARIWSGTKTATGGYRRLVELARVARRHTGRYLTPAVLRFALDTAAGTARRRLPTVLARPAVRVGKAVDRAIERRTTGCVREARETRSAGDRREPSR